MLTFWSSNVAGKSARGFSSLPRLIKVLGALRRRVPSSKSRNDRTFTVG